MLVDLLEEERELPVALSGSLSPSDPSGPSEDCEEREEREDARLPLEREPDARDDGGESSEPLPSLLPSPSALSEGEGEARRSSSSSESSSSSSEGGSASSSGSLSLGGNEASSCSASSIVESLLTFAVDLVLREEREDREDRDEREEREERDRDEREEAVVVSEPEPDFESGLLSEVPVSELLLL